jgi:cytochrome c peroxidase
VSAQETAPLCSSTQLRMTPLDSPLFDVPPSRSRPRAPGLLRWSSCLAIALAAVACSDADTTEAFDLVAQYELEPMPEMIHPLDNPPSAERVELGRLLFFDPIQSANRDVACGTCHLPRFGFTDARDLPLGPSGEGLGPERHLTDPNMVPEGRHSLTIINVGFNRFAAQNTADGFMFWDGRKRRLENLVLLPQREFSEMRADVYPIEVTVDTVLTRLRAIPAYEALFQEAFPDNAVRVAQGLAVSAIDSVSVSRSIAQFIRSLTSTESAYDRFVAGDGGALTEQQQRGLRLFHEKAACAACHSGPMFSDFDFHVLGVKQLGPGFQGTPHDDLGRWHVTRHDRDRYRFRTPSLRNLTLTAPFMHSGGYETIRDVLEFKNRGGGDHPFVDPAAIELSPLGLSEQELDDLEAFLEALTDDPGVDAPESVPSGLEVPR